MADGELKLQLDLLHERHSGLTPPLSGAFFEAASVCLGRHHTSPVEFEINCTAGPSRRTADFQAPDSRTLNAWANEIDTTESGAYCVCLAAVEAEEKLVAVGRAEKLTGADWYVAPIGVETDDLEDCFRLEVSGVDAGGKAVIDARLKQKVDQTRRGASSLPAIAAVVGFRERSISIQRVVDDR
jgi:hypothetical protein